MTTETATLLAVVAAPIAVLATVAAVAVGMLVRRGRRGLDRADMRLERQETVIREELVTARSSIEQMSTAVAAFRTQGDTLDADLAMWSASLSDLRQTIERLNRGRLGPAVRAMQLASALARVALVWRAPAR